MFGINWRSPLAKALANCAIAVVFLFALVACGDRIEEPPTVGEQPTALSDRGSQISEVSPPAEIQKLRQALTQYQPQVAILSPQPDEIVQDTTVTVKLQVRDLPLFKNRDLELGPHLQLILDRDHYQEVYNLDEPIVFQNLTPGTHTLRVFAARPWHENFKNDGAYAQTTFHLFAKTNHNSPDPEKPLLTYSRPQGTYGAEPILLDFYLTNAPLHFVAQENPTDEIADWRIRVTVNGESFVLDRWEPIYLKGFKPGKNWLQIEFLDDRGESVQNVFNNTVRLITYTPRGKDPLSRLVRGDLKAEDALAIVDPSYNPPPPTPEEPAIEEAIEEPVEPNTEPLLPMPEPEEMPVEVVPEEYMETPEPVEPESVEEPEETPAAAEPEEIIPTPETVEPEPDAIAPTPTPEAVETPTPAEAEAKTAEKSPWGRFLDRFRRQDTEPMTPAPVEEPSELAPEPVTPAPVTREVEPEPAPTPEVEPEPISVPEVEPEPAPEIEPEAEVESAAEPEPTSAPEEIVEELDTEASETSIYIEEEQSADSANSPS
ncbi:hypothetical protein [Phormidium sp. CCY1219]|uniref:hypothetical protein n=1 Tax=Phormidium sp. CCY1219 TaxID=2886104 RepID=UPI002D1EC380|nr:hypothetical protein [Phormidium sp. CCY1219]MEB3826070.1 hypothetical protein [Phormidium sp. CCY1219]